VKRENLTRRHVFAAKTHQLDRVGKQAALLVVKGNPAVNISEIEKVEIVFKDE
jgi:imidazolonepropionase-like amidohydrolase